MEEGLHVIEVPCVNGEINHSFYMPFPSAWSLLETKCLRIGAREIGERHTLNENAQYLWTGGSRHRPLCKRIC